MRASSRSVVRGERIVAMVTACVVLVLFAGGVWATRHGSSDGGPVALASPSAPPALQPTMAAAGAAPAPEVASALPRESAVSPAAGDGAQTEAPSPAPQASGGGQQTQTPSTMPSRTAATPSATPTPKPTRSRTSPPTPTPTKTAPAADVPDAPFIVVQGKVKKKTYLTVRHLKKMNVFTGDYFSRGTEPPAATNTFVGVRLADILRTAGLKADAGKVDVRAADDYSASFTLRQVKAAWLDETRPGVRLPVIIAWSEDGVAYTGDHPFRLVMGQAVEGHYNRQYWVSYVVAITVQ